MKPGAYVRLPDGRVGRYRGDYDEHYYLRGSPRVRSWAIVEVDGDRQLWARERIQPARKLTVSERRERENDP